ncbi:MAG TPA: L-seryl-tRNA(Sec) selenium transferase, partial [Ktedonobacterales bacterium]|nr:L-seryl-tRNA(Sec) selenium transferase [Ktedonobacterales bacterium]
TGDGIQANMRALPSVEEARQALLTRRAETGAPSVSHAALVRAIRSTLQSVRDDIRAGAPAPQREELIERMMHVAALQARSNLRSVINATGVVINTNLGRAPLSERAIAQISAVARGYSNLEFDLEAGERGSRQAHTRAALRELTGAEDALAVNNNAAATLVALAALAAGRDVIIARGELVEIGGGFRVPDIMAQSGARLVEVGTTNRVRLADYATAITPEAGLLLVVHPSNFRIIGFTESPALSDLAALAHERGLLLMHDLGSGAVVSTERWGMAHEPTIAESVRAGADIVCFSGDKLLGGPQAGIMIGRRETLARIERHPLMRAIRIDKLTLAALEATLRAYLDDTFADELPVWRAISQTHAELSSRTEALSARLQQAGVSAEVIAGESTVGGGSLPGETLPTVLCALPARADAHLRDAARLADLLRQGEPPIVARVLRDQTLLDLRAVAPADDDALFAGIITAWSSASR